MGLAFGVLDWRVAQLMFMAAILYGTMISMASVLLEELSFRRYLRMLDVCRRSQPPCSRTSAIGS